MSALIGVTPETHGGSRLKTRTPDEKIVYLYDRYLQALLDAGAAAVVLPVTEDRRLIRSFVSRLDGLVLMGSNYDVLPELYGDKPKPWIGGVKPDRSRFELALVKEALRNDIPILGICGGMQAVNVALGGTLYQDIANERPGSGNHQQKTRHDKLSHQVSISPGTKLHAIASGRKSCSALKLRVNSTHHQAVKKIGRGLEVNATATDGLVEGIESLKHRFVLGVQWHPELLYTQFDEHGRIFKAFVRAAEAL